MQGIMRRNRLAICFIVAFGLGYSCFLGSFLSPYAGGADSSGYLIFSRLLTQGQILAPVRELPGHTVTEFGEGTYQPQGFSVRDNSGFMSPTYPVGLPLHLALATRLVGSSHAVAMVNILGALAAAVLMYASCRHLNIRVEWAAAATVALCISPFFLSSALQPMSDLLATSWALGTLYAAMRSREDARAAVFCGIAFGVAVLIRPTNILLAFPILVGLGFNPLRLASAALGALPAALFVLYLNFRLFGSPVTTGYGSPLQILKAVHADASEPYSVIYVRHHLTHFAYWIALYLGPLVIFALALPFFRQGRTRDWALQVVWIGVLIGFYAFYQPAGETWWYVRFLLPCLPQLIMLAAGGVSAAWDRVEKVHRAPVRYLPPLHPLREGSRIRRIISAFVLATLSIGWLIIATHYLSILSIADYEKNYLETTKWMVEHLPSDALIWSSGTSGAIYYYTEFPIIRFDFIDQDKLPILFKAAETLRRPMYAVVWHHEVGQMISRLGHDNWAKVADLSGPIAVFKYVR
jgi:Dolichyl-phosphate-mannose-protein mannosyltransferase